MCAAALFMSCSEGVIPNAPEDDEQPGQGNEQEAPAEKNGPIRILAIGNSFSVNAVEQNLHELMTAAGYKCEIGNMYIGGCTLEQHVNNLRNSSPAYEYRKVDISGKHTNQPKVSLRQALTDGEWDFISVQQASKDSGKFDTYEASLAELLNYISEYCPDAEIVLHQTWAYAQYYTSTAFASYGNNQQQMYDAIVATSSRVMQEYGFTTIIPSGTAIQNLRMTSIGDNLNSDGTHLNTLGCYTAACTWCEALVGTDVRSNPYVRSDLPAESQQQAKEAAHYAVESPFAVSY